MKYRRRAQAMTAADSGNQEPYPVPRRGVLVERVQTGVRIERSLLKVLKALAEYLDMPLGDLLEGIALHALEGKSPFSPDTLEVVRSLRQVYGLTLTAEDSHRLSESGRSNT
jgi:predicted DNA-binding ribbon-helix-helix protein